MPLAQMLGWNSQLHRKGAISSFAYDVNDLGEVVGKAEFEGRTTRAMIWSASEITEIGDPGDRFAAVAINEHSQVVIQGSPAGDSRTRSYLLDGEVFTELPCLGGDTCQIFAINNHGWAVGESSAPEGAEPGFWRHAVLRVSGETYDLNDLVSDDSEWELVGSTAVNDRGQILAFGVSADSGYHTYLLLTPMGTTDLIEELIDDVRELIDDGVIRYSRGRSLIAELQVALWFLEFRGGERIALIRLELFVLKVERLVRSAELDPEIGADLVRRAEAIIEMLRQP